MRLPSLPSTLSPWVQQRSVEAEQAMASVGQGVGAQCVTALAMLVGYLPWQAGFGGGPPRKGGELMTLSET
jgi:hypothetical protein